MKHIGAAKLVILTIATTILAVAAGCASSRPIAPLGGPFHKISAAEADARAEAVRADPLAYLREVRDNCRTLQQYSLNFTRQERRGFFRTLGDPERIACKFRREPFSIHMKWLDPDIKYGESTYVAGAEDDKVRFVPRHGLFGLPPRVTRVGLQTPVIWGEAKYPLTEFGLEKMMDRTIRNIERSPDEVSISYQGLTKLAESGRPVHFLRLEFPPSRHRSPIQELFVDLETDLPICTRVLNTSGSLEGAYLWEDVDPTVSFTEDDFLLEAERAAREGQDSRRAGEGEAPAEPAEPEAQARTKSPRKGATEPRAERTAHRAVAHD